MGGPTGPLLAPLSAGGVVTAGLAIYDTMQYILNPICTWCVGQAASMGSLLLAAGSPGMRHSLPNSRIMIHQPSGGARVSAHSARMSHGNQDWCDTAFCLLERWSHHAALASWSSPYRPGCSLIPEILLTATALR